MIKIYSTPTKTVEKFAEYLERLIEKSVSKNKEFYLSLSGGSTPQRLFKELKKNYSKSIKWQYVHFFWGDERCVSVNDPESNYGVARELLLNSIDIPEENIHYINGEESPEIEAVRYSNEILKIVPIKNGLPSFDICILGLGTDGHTASIFPDQMKLLESNKICEVATHPESGQKRITITGEIINNSSKIYFLVTGESKKEVVAEILKSKDNYLKYPASHIKPSYGNLSWYLDESAGSLI